jgi:hypothetical protein
MRCLSCHLYSSVHSRQRRALLSNLPLFLCADRWTFEGIRRQWRSTEPWQRRNAVLGGAVILWAVFLSVRIRGLLPDSCTFCTCKK